MTDNAVIGFERRKINEWPRNVYLADFEGTGDARAYRFIQHPDDTTPLYIRADIAIPKDEADAMVTAAIFECALAVQDYSSKDFDDERGEYVTTFADDHIRAVVLETDARAALDRIVQEARDEGYEKGRSRGFAEGRAMAHQHDAPFCEAVNKAEMQAAVEAEREHITTCVVCGRIIDKREQEDGGDEFGAQMANGDWVCSTECEETAIRKGDDR